MAPGSTRKDRKKARQEKETQLCIRFSHSQLCQFCSWVCTICRYFLFDFRRRRVSWWRWSKASELCCALASSSVSFSIPLSNVVASYNIAFSLGSPIVFVGVPRKGLAPFVNNSNQTGNTVILGVFLSSPFSIFPPQNWIAVTNTWETVYPRHPDTFLTCARIPATSLPQNWRGLRVCSNLPLIPSLLI